MFTRPLQPLPRPLEQPLVWLDVCCCTDVPIDGKTGWRGEFFWGACSTSGFRVQHRKVAGGVKARIWPLGLAAIAPHLWGR